MDDNKDWAEEGLYQIEDNPMIAIDTGVKVHEGGQRLRISFRDDRWTYYWEEWIQQGLWSGNVMTFIEGVHYPAGERIKFQQSMYHQCRKRGVACHAQTKDKDIAFSFENALTGPA